jgi:hypothetical protein
VRPSWLTSREKPPTVPLSVPPQTTKPAETSLDFDADWLANFYKECGREITLAYTTLNQMKNWALVTAAAVISGLSFGTSAVKYPNVPMFTGTVIVYGFVLRFYIRAIICYINLERWNALQKACVERRLWKGSPHDNEELGAANAPEDELVTTIRNYYFRWLSPISRKTQLLSNLKLGFMLLFTLTLFFLLWGLVVLRNDPIVRGLAVWAAGITVLELHDFKINRVFDSVSDYERKKSKSKLNPTSPVSKSGSGYVAKWLLVLAMSLAVTILSEARTVLPQLELEKAFIR